MYDVLAIGNAICDILIKVEDSVLEKFKLTKGSMSLISTELSQEILQYLKDNHFTMCSGGSAANTINYLSQYELNTAFLGNVSNGYYGKKFYSELTAAGIEFYNVHDDSDNETAKCIILVTPDGERTMCTSLGCAANLNLEKIDLKKLTNSKYVYIEGYLWDHPETITAILKIISAAKHNDAQIVFSLSDSFCVKRHLKEFQELVNNKIDIVFGNESEICELFEVSDFSIKNTKTIQKKLLATKPKMIITTQNNKGCTIITPEEITNAPTIEKTPLDTTGAGDSFAAGFIYSLIQNFEFDVAANISNHIAGQVITHLGARPEILLPKNNEDLLNSA